MPSLSAPEKSFYRVLEDLHDHLPALTLVGGWVPFIYARHVWKTETAHLVTTVDIDFGLTGQAPASSKETIFETLSKLDYRERHFDIGRLRPIVFYKEGKIPVEFIADAAMNTTAIAAILGPEIHVNKLEGFEFLMKNRFGVHLRLGSQIKTLYCPAPSAFLFHKLATFTARAEDVKKAKDLFYAYFFLRYVPDIASLYREVREYREQGVFPQVPGNIETYFSSLTSRGCLWVERENGPDEYVRDVRRDAHERFNKLKEALQSSG